MNEDLPFKVEYAKSGRAACKKCKGNIGKDVLRMAIMVQSPMFDGKMPLWHHLACFFQKKNKLTCTSEIANFQNLRWDDQEKIKKHLGGAGGGDPGASGSSGNSDFSVEYAKSNKSTCRGCAEKIQKGVLRVSKLDTDNPEMARYGPTPLWHHVDCFVKRREELGYHDAAEKLPGYKELKDDDKQMLMEKIPSKGMKRKPEVHSPPKAKKSVRQEDSTLKEQNEMLFNMRDDLKKHLSKKQMTELLQHNNQHVPTGDSRILDHLADCMTFGGIAECPDCKNGRPRFLENVYKCPGNLSEWTKCQYSTKYPTRELFFVPEDFREEFPFLEKYECKVKERKLPEASEESSKKQKLPLFTYKIGVIGKFQIPKDIIRRKIEELGATYQASVSSATNLCISTPSEVASASSKMEKARSNNIHIVSYDFLEAVRKGSKVPQAVKEHCICDWGDDPTQKFGMKKENGETSSKGQAMDMLKSAPQKIKLKMDAKGGAVVDPESGLEDTCHVYQKKDAIFNVVLAQVDAIKGTNAFYKLQLLESNKKAKYHLFRQWGRVGTTIGGKKVEKFESLEDALTQFEFLYHEKTGNKWKDRKNFVKQPRHMYPLDIDYGEEAKQFAPKLEPGANSKLDRPIQELICLLFDVETMKKAMLEFEIDLKKMPLGKLSKKQIESAYSVLSEAQEVITSGSNISKIMDVTNRFYTLIPHDFGMKKPPLLEDEEMIKAKIEMLDSLLEIEFAYNLIKGGDHDARKDPVDEHYEKLKTEIDVLKHDSDEYKIVKKYLKNTHAPTHDNYNLELEEVFKISRQGEEDRYKKFKDLHNKKLLWHGSRLTNYVGILSQGLRIAPPEAPVTGYMFGKGIYFADMVSKSANYCCTSRSNPTGLLLLCEVALGNMYEKTNSEFITKLPKDKQSTLGLGKTIPDPKEKTVIDSAEVPLGKPVKSKVSNSQLLYNEYIVYDINQVNIKYLLKVNFKWKR